MQICQSIGDPRRRQAGRRRVARAVATNDPVPEIVRKAQLGQWQQKHNRAGAITAGRRLPGGERMQQIGMPERGKGVRLP